jgi:hypothetical protein
MKLETKNVLGLGCAIFIGMSEELVPDVERVLLILPQFFPTEIRYWRSVKDFLHRFAAIDSA